MLRKALQLLALTFLTFIFSGCIEVRMETELHADGSGQGAIEIAIHPQVSEKLAQVAHLTDLPRTTVGDLADLDADRLQAIAEPAGVQIDSFESEVRDGRKTVSFKLDFDSLEDYSWVLGNVLDEVGEGVGVFAGEEGRLVFKEAEYDFSALATKVPALPDRTDPGDEAMDMYLELQDVINAHVADATVVNVITVPADIVDADATAMEGRTCTWDLDFAAIVADKDNLKPMIVFDGAGLGIEPLVE